MSEGELILYTSEDGRARIQLRAENGSIWMSQSAMAELFQTTVSSINIHVKNILDEGELAASATIKEGLMIRQEGSREVRRSVKQYNLEMILAVGYRVKSLRGAQLRQWATTHLREFLIKGFVLDDNRLKDSSDRDYFEELLERIRDIRASDKRFYQKVRAIFATATDYDSRSAQAQLFFKKVQNQMLWAVTGHTEAELVASRSDAAAANMGVLSFKGDRVRSGDVTIARNYLDPHELDELNRVVVMYLDYAEDMARRRKPLSMADWEERLTAFLKFNEREVLTHAGKVTAEVAAKLALDRYGEFSSHRRETERLQADAEDAQVLEQLEAVQKRMGKA